MTKRRGDWMQTYSGVQFWPLDPRPEDVRIIDIAHALAHLCRFGGHCRRFYSVAQHSVLVALHAPKPLRKKALLHDAAETYVIDVPRPIKHYLGGYDEAEMRNAAAIGQHFGVDLGPFDPSDPGCKTIKELDNRALWTEKRDLLVPSPVPWGVPQGLPAEPWATRLLPLDPEEAEDQFLSAAIAFGLVTHDQIEDERRAMARTITGGSP